MTLDDIVVGRYFSKTDHAWRCRARRAQTRGDVQIGGKRFEVVNAAAKAGDAAEMFIYDYIDEWGVTPSAVAAALSGITASKILVHLNSQGGDVFMGMAIYTLLNQKNAEIVVQVDGVAASIASVLMLAGDEVVLARNAMIMIHNAWGGCVGNADEMRACAAILESVDQQVTDIYVEQTGAAADDVVAMMKAETWMNAATAMEKGFCDAVLDANGARASATSGLSAKSPVSFWRSGMSGAAQQNAATLTARLRTRTAALSLEV